MTPQNVVPMPFRFSCVCPYSNICKLHALIAEVIHFLASSSLVNCSVSENTFEKNDYICVGIDNMIAKLGGEKVDESVDNCAYVLTNSTNIYGSTALADPTALQMVKQTINEDEYCPFKW